jgi:hypothetical protein
MSRHRAVRKQRELPMIHPSQKRMERHARGHWFGLYFVSLFCRGFALRCHRSRLSSSFEVFLTSNPSGMVMPHENSNGPCRRWQIGCEKCLRVPLVTPETEWLPRRLFGDDFGFILIK